MPYRGSASSLPKSSSTRFSFAFARVRLGVDRFEMSFVDSTTGVIILLCSSVSFLASARLGFVLSAVLLLTIPLWRVALLVTPEGAWGSSTLCGACWRRRELGHHPAVEADGWDWSEIAVVPRNPALAKVLHDGQRFVLAEWQDDNQSKNEEASILIALANAQIERLHRGAAIYGDAY